MAKGDCVRCTHCVVCKYRSSNEQLWIKEHCKLAARDERPHGEWMKGEKEARKRPYRWLNRSTMTSHNEECGKCHFVFYKIPQYFPFCPMCGEHLLPIYRKGGEEE